MITFEIIQLPANEFTAKYISLKDKPIWYYRFIRAFRYQSVIYVNNDARFIFPWSKEDVILHEVGHILGYKHRWLGVMSWHGMFRM